MNYTHRKIGSRLNVFPPWQIRGSYPLLPEMIDCSPTWKYEALLPSFPSPELQDSTVGPHPFALGKMYANWARKWPSMVVTPDCWPIRRLPMNIAGLAGTSYGYAGWGQIVYMFDIVLYSVCYEFLYSIYVWIKCVSDSLCLYQRSEVIQSCLERSAIVF